MTFLKPMVIFFFLFILFLLLTQPSSTLTYASYGLTIWYKSMLPALFPMMIITGCMIKLNITTQFSALIHPIAKPLFHLSKNGTYALFTGFLCGFPMGAKVICDLYSREKISKKEANALLPICNNIGPIFMLSYGLKQFSSYNLVFSLALFYAIPLLYAFFIFRKKSYSEITFYTEKKVPFSLALDESIAEGATGMLSLAGYLMFFNILLLIPMEILPVNNYIKSFLCCFLEITNGLSYTSVLPPYFYFALLQFGGLCCIFQTSKYMCKTDLDFKNYLLHKLNLTLLTFIIFFVYDCVYVYVVLNV